jgi:hypothetical protein
VPLHEGIPTACERERKQGLGGFGNAVNRDLVRGSPADGYPRVADHARRISEAGILMLRDSYSCRAAEPGVITAKEL